MCPLPHLYIINIRMEGEGLCVQQFPQDVVLREDDHKLQRSAYFQVTSRNFECCCYDHGSPQLKQRYRIQRHLYRYFNKRNYLFSRFEQGIRIDEESWYSVIPEPVSLYLKQRFLGRPASIFEPFCGVGGIAIHLAGGFEEYIVNDIDPQKLSMLRHNLAVYGKSVNSLKFINQDFLQVEPFRTDLLIICPPWGGIETDAYASFPPDELMRPKLSDILSHAKQFAGEMLLQMPKQTNLGHLVRVMQQVGLNTVFTVEKILTNGKCSQLFIYIGSEGFTGINSAQLYNHLYRDLAVTNKHDKKRLKAQLRTDPTSLMAEVYRAQYPLSPKEAPVP